MQPFSFFIGCLLSVMLLKRLSRSKFTLCAYIKIVKNKNNKQAIRTVSTREKYSCFHLFINCFSNYSTLTFLVCDNYTLISHYLSYIHCSNDYNDHDIDEHEDNDGNGK